MEGSKRDQSISLTTVQRETSTNSHETACGESTAATLLLTEDSIKNFLRECYTNSFWGITLATLIMLLPQPRPQRKDTQGSRMVPPSIVFWKKLCYFKKDLWWNTFQNPPFIQWCSKLNTRRFRYTAQFWNFIYRQKK